MSYVYIVEEGNWEREILDVFATIEAAMAAYQGAWREVPEQESGCYWVCSGRSEDRHISRYEVRE